ncbi:MAG: carboxypeptidase-like regulatory domain-containing protein [Acidobacteriia bacterium]|nr:carboxypeptidase-like regulatory domain-containing protein [Terriglobia bacterium]
MRAASPASDDVETIIQVVSRTSQQAVGRASLDLRGAGEQTRHLEADANGQVKLRLVPGKRYYLEAARPDFVKSPVIVLVPADGAPPFVVRLTPVASISGAVHDPEGIPLAGVDVRVLRRIYSRGRPSLEYVDRTTTEADGEFKFATLVPGTYYVRALYRNNRTDRSGEGYGLAFYPNAPDPESAAPLVVSAGARTAGIDMILARGPLAVIRGHVVRWEDRSPIPGSSLALYPMGYETGGLDYWGARSERSNERGAFAFVNVIPGSYFLVAQEFRGAWVGVEVTDRAPDVVVYVGRQAQLEGHVTWKDVPTGADRPAHVEAGLDPVEFSQAARPRSSIDPAGAFRLSGLGAGLYTLVLTGLPSDAFVESATYGQQELDGLTIRYDPAAPAHLDLVLSCAGATLSARVAAADGQPAYAPLVTLIPDSGRPADYRAEQADETGVAHISGIRPGTYKVMAWSSIVSGGYRNAGYMKPYESKAVAVVLGKGETKALELVAVEGQ